MSLYRGFNKKLENYLVSPLEILILLFAVSALVYLSLENFHASQARGYERSAKETFDKLKQAIYNNMSSPTPTRRFLMKNIIGPGPLPPPLEDVFLNKDIKLNYLIRVYEPSARGQPKDQLRFEVTHDKAHNLYRYFEVNGVLLEQVVAKE